ncbi:hypothetical protein LguiA_009189 [Lonicera macranthoides]
MSSPQSLCAQILSPSLEKINKNIAWRKHSNLTAACKSVLENLNALSSSSSSFPSNPSSSPLFGFSPADAEFLLNPLILALHSNSIKITSPALDCTFKLFSTGLIRTEILPPEDNNRPSLIFQLIDSVSKCGNLRDDGIELAVLKVLLSAVRSPFVLVRGDCLVNIVRTCYNVYLGGLSGTNQICAKSVLAQMMIIVFTRVEEGAMGVRFRTVSAAELLEFTDRSLNEGNSIHVAQKFIIEVVEDSKQSFGFQNGDKIEKKSDGIGGEEEGVDLSGYINKIKEDGFMLFKNLCKLSMKFTSQQHKDDQILLRGKTLSLELLKVIMDNGGVDPSFLQKMTVLHLLERISRDSQIIIDIFVNYDCDVDSPNIFERTVNGLHKTALGPPPGSTTTLSPVQDLSFRLESVKCLVRIIQSMGAWIDQQLRMGDFFAPNTSDNENSIESHANLHSDEVNPPNFELPSEAISLFNQKPSKGIDHLTSSKKISDTPEAVASFLKNTAGLNGSMIGDYLGETEGFPLKVMHAYVDSFNFEEMDVGEAIRVLLKGFRLPGEAQKIDHIMEKFAERYCKSNPNSFRSADTAYALAYSVIVLNTDAHNNMVKDKMMKADFIRNNQGIDNGKDLPEEYLGALYDEVVQNEIKMKADASVPQSKQWNSINKLLGSEGILNLVKKQSQAQRLGANGDLIKHIQKQFKSKSGNSDFWDHAKCHRSVYFTVADATILRFMVEVCWAPMLAAFSVTLDKSVDKAATSQCLQGFRHAVHVTAVTGMQTQRDAFVTTVAKFTYLHCAADMKQKNVDTVKAIISIAVEDGNYLEEAWEHILTCLSRFEHLQLLGEGNASFFTASNTETEEKTLKTTGLTSLKKKGTLQNPSVMAVMRGGSYDSTTHGVNTSGLVKQEQISNFISNLNLLDQIGNFELNHIFVHSQRLNSVAIVAFVKALCKVSMSELQSPTDPRVFSLTKLVEIASTSAEIRELIVRCISQMVLSHVNNVKSGWESVFMVFRAAAADERKNIALLAFENMEKLVREYFPYITETESVSFTDCMNCLITFTNSQFGNDVSLRAISFLQFCAVKLADEGLICNDTHKDDGSSIQLVNDSASNGQTFTYKDDHISFWMPLLTGLSRLTSDSRSAIRKSALEVLFNILKDHGHLFSRSFWASVFNSVIFPVFKSPSIKKETRSTDAQSPLGSISPHPDGRTWDPETSTVATQCLVDLFVTFYNVMWSQLPEVMSILAGFLKSHGQGSASIGVAAVMRLAGNLGGRLSTDEWADIFSALKKVAASTVPGFLKLVGTMDNIEIPNVFQSYNVSEILSANGFTHDDSEEDNLHTAAHISSRLKSHIASQLLIIQVITDLCKMHPQSLSASNIAILDEIFSSIASHAHQLNSKTNIRLKLHKACFTLDISEPPLVHFENESYRNHLNFLLDLLIHHPSLSDESNIEPQLIAVSKQALNIYLDYARSHSVKRPEIRWILPLGSAKKEELGARTSLVVSALRVLSCLERHRLKRYASYLFPLFIDLMGSEHSSSEVQISLRDMLESCIGPIVMDL